ncbi:hypothetical protein SESBI_38946 [Sesbania bispinosa]|nr:hypothetical protein SESBI_38946 [Sesbania bispinosa]
MWVVAPATGATGGSESTIWMLLVTAGAATATSESQAMWPLTAASPPPPQSGGGNSTPTPTPLHFMSRFNLLGGLEFQGGRGLQLGSMYQPSQHLGLAMFDSNLGMLAALNAYTRGGGLKKKKLIGNEFTYQHAYVYVR